MKITRKIHPMLDEKTQKDIFYKKGAKIINFSYGKNPLNGSWMYWFDISPQMYTGPKKSVNEIIKNIEKTFEVVQRN